jgi:hypothetical protein
MMRIINCSCEEKNFPKKLFLEESDEIVVVQVLCDDRTMREFHSPGKRDKARSSLGFEEVKDR